MDSSPPSASSEISAFAAAILGEPDPAEVTAFARTVLGEPDPEEAAAFARTLLGEPDPDEYAAFLAAVLGKDSGDVARGPHFRPTAHAWGRSTTGGSTDEGLFTFGVEEARKEADKWVSL